MNTKKVFISLLLLYNSSISSMEKDSNNNDVIHSSLFSRPIKLSEGFEGLTEQDLQGFHRLERLLYKTAGTKIKYGGLIAENINYVLPIIEIAQEGNQKSKNFEYLPLSKKVECLLNTIKQQKPIFVRTNDNQITLINKKNISHMYVLDVMNAHQHKDFAFIAEEKKKKNSLENPLDACCITRFTGADLQLLNKALDKSKNKETFYNFYSSLKRNEQVMLFDAAIQVQSSKIISLLGLPLPQETQDYIISYITPQLPSVTALKKAILRKTPPMISVLEGHEKFKGKVVWNPDNSVMVSAHNHPSKLILRNGQTGKPITTLTEKECIKNIVFSPDGTRLLYKNDSTGAYLCDGHTGEPMHMLIGEIMIFSPDSKTVVTCGKYNYQDKKVPLMIYNAENGNLLQTTMHSAAINNLTFAPDSQHFISVGKGHHNEQTVLWNIKGEKIKSLEGHNGNAMTHAVFSSDHSRLATGSYCYSSNENLILRDGKTGDKIKNLKGHEGNKIEILLFSPDNNYLLSGAHNSSMGGKSKFIIWGGKCGTCITIFKQTITFGYDLVAFASDSSFLVIRDTLYDAQTFNPMATLFNPQLKDTLDLKSPARGIALSPDGNRIAAVQDDKLVLYTLISDKISDVLNAIQSDKANLFQMYLFKKLCNKLGVKKEKKYKDYMYHSSGSGNFSA